MFQFFRNFFKTKLGLAIALAFLGLIALAFASADVSSTGTFGGIAGLRLGRISDVPVNDRPFGTDEVAIAQDWCRRSGIPYLGRADIGHDAANKIVPFGLETRGARD